MAFKSSSLPEGARPEARAASLPQSSLESAFSGVYRGFQRVRAPKCARPPTAAWRVRLVAFSVVDVCGVSVSVSVSVCVCGV